MSADEYIDWVEYLSCYVMITCNGLVYEAKIYNVDFESCRSEDKDICLFEAMGMVERYINSNKANHIDPARPIPELDLYTRVLIDDPCYQIISQDVVSLEDAFVRFGYKFISNMFFSEALILYRSDGGATLSAKGTFAETRYVDIRKRIFFLCGVPEHCLVVIEGDNSSKNFEIYSIGSGAVKVEFDNNKIIYNNNYVVKVYKNGLLFDEGRLSISSDNGLELCRIKGCSTICKSSVSVAYVALSSDYNRLNNVFKCDVFSGILGCLESGKCCVCAFFRYVANCCGDSGKISEFVDKCGNGWFRWFLKNYVIIYDKNFKEIDAIEEIDWSKYWLDGIFCQNDSDEDYVLSASRGGINVDQIVFEELTLILGYCDDVGVKCGSKKYLIEAYKICWEYLVCDDKHRIYNFILRKIVDGEFDKYEDICQSFEGEGFRLKDVADIFNLKKGFNHAENKFVYPPQFMASRLKEIDDISKLNYLPVPCRKAHKKR